MDGGAWWVTVHGVTKSWTRLNYFTFFFLCQYQHCWHSAQVNCYVGIVCCLAPSQISSCCQKGDPIHGPKVDSCLTLGNALSEAIHVLAKAEDIIGKGPQEESSRGRGPRELLCQAARSFRVYGNRMSFHGFLWPVILLMTVFGPTQSPSPGACTHRQDGFWSVSRRLTRHIMDRCFLLLSGSSWILLAGSVDSPMFLIKPLLLWHTHASSYYHAWPSQAVLVTGSLT